jgi:hypothetical protein
MLGSQAIIQPIDRRIKSLGHGEQDLAVSLGRTKNITPAVQVQHNRGAGMGARRRLVGDIELKPLIGL